MTSSKKKSLTSSKKKKSKAAKNQAARDRDAAANFAVTVLSSINGTGDTLSPDVKRKFIECIRKGEDNCTKLVLAVNDRSTSWDSRYNDIVPIVLNFLKRCEHETFHKVMSGIGGDLIFPFLLGENSSEGSYICAKL